MAIVNVVDWKIFLSPDCDIPPDVSFLVNDKTIRAHSKLLGAVSRVFRQQLFGPMKDDKEEIKVEMTTAEAFQTMIDFIYGRAGQDTFNLDNIKCPQKLFEVLELAERYEILDLKTSVMKALESFVVTRDKMILSANVAINNKVLFEDFSVILFTKCLKFLQDTAKNPHDMSSLIEDTLSSFPGVSPDILLELRRVKDEKLLGNISRIP